MLSTSLGGHDRSYSGQISKSKNNQQFISSLRNSRISTDINSKQFVEYEIACKLFYSNNIKIHSKNVITWSNWRRYSELESFHTSFKKEMGWRADDLVFPSSYLLVYNKFDWQFIDKRREELSLYWNNVLAIERVTDFGTPQCSKLLQTFLNINSVIASTINVQDTSLFLPVNTHTKIGSTTINSLPIFDPLDNHRRYSTGGLFAKNNMLPSSASSSTTNSSTKPNQYPENCLGSVPTTSPYSDRVYQDTLLFKPASLRPRSDNTSFNKFPFPSSPTSAATTSTPNATAASSTMSSTNNNNNTTTYSANNNSISNANQPPTNQQLFSSTYAGGVGESKLPDTSIMTTPTKSTDINANTSGLGGTGAPVGGGGVTVPKAPPGVNKVMIDMKSNMLAEIRAKKKK